MLLYACIMHGLLVLCEFSFWLCERTGGLFVYLQ
jgi:hypothetical protein